MATISKRGSYQFQAIIRRTGYPTQTKTNNSGSSVLWVRLSPSMKRFMVAIQLK